MTMSQVSLFRRRKEEISRGVYLQCKIQANNRVLLQAFEIRLIKIVSYQKYYADGSNVAQDKSAKDTILRRKGREMKKVGNHRMQC